MEDLVNHIPRTLPVIYISNVVMYPYLMIPLIVSEDSVKKVVEHAIGNDKLLGFFLAKKIKDDGEVELYDYGTVVSIVRLIRNADGSLSLLLQGVTRIKIDKIVQHHPFMMVEITEVVEHEDDSAKMRAIRKITTELLEKVISESVDFNKELIFGLKSIKQHSRVADIIAGNLPFPAEVKQDLLETINLRKRYEKLNKHLADLIKQIKLETTIRNNVQLEIDEDQKNHYLREQLEAIKKELGEYNETDEEIMGWLKKLGASDMPTYAAEAFRDELNRLTTVPQSSSEYAVIRNYLEWLINIPWQTMTEDRLDLIKIDKVLTADHHGLTKPKERILEYIAVKKLKESQLPKHKKKKFDIFDIEYKQEHTKAPILCFVGPPGVGKTSIGSSIARAMNRKFIRMSLGGIHDEAEIRGHRRTYIGSMPGKILSEIKRCKVSNPVFMLDEIDKVGKDFRGDPSSALLEVLDPEQNHAFMDNYINLPYDLSKCFFITTANALETIPPALQDRMEIIEFSSYIEEEKIAIAKKYLIPKELKNNGITSKHIQIKTSAIIEIIRYYVREAGVRNLQRTIASVMRKVARKVAEWNDSVGTQLSTSGGATSIQSAWSAVEADMDDAPRPTFTKVIVTDADIPKYLGSRKYLQELSGRKDEIGIATGLAWTSSGGEILFCEATLMPGKGNMILTGSLGEVMQESAQLALSYIKANSHRYGIDSAIFEKNDIHIHLPAGAVPKEGPSAGVTLTTALVSLLTTRKVKHNIAMTGEITLFGKVLPVGGISEKVLAAKRAGILTVCMPAENQDSFDEIEKDITKGIKVHYVKTVDEVLEQVLV